MGLTDQMFVISQFCNLGPVTPPMFFMIESFYLCPEVAECRAFGNGIFKDLGRTRRPFGPSVSPHLMLNLYPCFSSGAKFCLYI